MGFWYLDMGSAYGRLAQLIWHGHWADMNRSWDPKRERGSLSALRATVLLLGQVSGGFELQLYT